MSGASSNAAAVAAKIAKLIASVSFESQGDDQSLGRDLLAAVGQDIIKETSRDQRSPDGSPLAPNRGKYGERKRSKNLHVGAGLRSKARGDDGRMLSEMEIVGEQTITPDTATMRFGRSDRSRRVAGWFTNGDSGDDPSGAEGAPARPFYGMSAASKAARTAEIRAFVRDLIAEF